MEQKLPLLLEAPYDVEHHTIWPPLDETVVATTILASNRSGSSKCLEYQPIDLNASEAKERQNNTKGTETKVPYELSQGVSKPPRHIPSKLRGRFSI